jgi:hypothetical protein
VGFGQVAHHTSHVGLGGYKCYGITVAHIRRP